MQFRSSAPAALLVALAGLSGCSGGSASVGSVTFDCAGDAAKALCLQSCSLGCSATGCLRTDIAQNEIIVLQFSEDIDPSTVNTTTIQLRTASGDLPVGDFLVVGNRVEFKPTLRVSGGQTFFGFVPEETYTLALPGGVDAVCVTSTSGHKFKEPLTCSLVVSQGIKDLNGVPPRATLVSPSASQLGGAPRTTVIQLDFNEMVDATPFLAAGGGSGPVTFSLRRTRLNTLTGLRECDAGSQPVVLPGTPRLDFDSARDVSVLTFRSTADLPANTCIEINVTGTVTDLAGTPAQPQSFVFLTESVPLTEVAVTEEFDNETSLDRDVSSGTWAGGLAEFGLIGGDGRHGACSFPLPSATVPDQWPAQNVGVIAGKRTYVFNTDATVIPASRTRNGEAVAVSDGRFYFTSLFVPGDVRLRFTGSVPPQITVSGKIDVQGEIDIAGKSLTTLPLNTQLTGQLGAEAGIFGGAGGQGGDKCLGTGYLPGLDGRAGSASRVLGTRAYATSVSLTGGRGSSVFPTNGLSSSLIFNQPSGVNYTPSAAAGGGGGALLTDGAIGRVVTNNHIDPVLLVAPRLDAMGPPANGGVAVQFFPFPAGSGSARSSEHFLVGGSGGGGAGSQATLAIAAINPRVWSPGGGGGGGGGAISLRAGDSMSLGALARIFANGGSAASSTGVTASASPAPGGGGSGGSVVLQCGRTATVAGVIDVRGGAGGSFTRSAGGAPPAGAAVTIQGGAGSPGFVRCEVPGSPTVALLANMLPAPIADNVATLTEADDEVSFQSTWYSTNLPYGPEYARYEIYATVNGAPVIYSDDPAVSTVPAQGPAAAIRAFFQNANLDLVTGAPVPLPGETEVAIRPWRTSVLSLANQTGIASDGLNGFRFALVLDRRIAATVTIDKVKIVYRV